jgi:hypothetical protein
MLFVYPYLLWGLLAVSVPIIIHLFNLQRYKKVYFTNVRFLQQLQQQSRRQSVLRHWLALLFRILAIAALVLAFAKPFIPSPLGTISESDGLVSVYVDNSFSMETEGRNGYLIDEALTKSIEIKESHSRSDKFNLLTNDFLGIHHRAVSGDEFLTMLEDVTISPSVRTLSAVLGRQYDILNRDNLENKSLYLISDFQRNAVDLDGFVPDSTIRHYLIYLEPQGYSNLSIDTCWFDAPAQQPGQVVQLHVVVSNHSDRLYEKVPLRLIINGTQRAIASVDLPPLANTSHTLAFTIRDTGLHSGYVELSDFPITFDDRLYFSFNVPEQINVLHIFEQRPGPWLRALFAPDTLFRFSETPLRQLNYADIFRQQFIVLNGLRSISSGLAAELSRFLENGGSLMIIPAAVADIASYNDWMRNLNTVTFVNPDTSRIRVADLNLLHYIYKDVFMPAQGGRPAIGPDTDLPNVFFRYGLNFPSRKDVQTLISLRNAEPFLVADRYSSGNVFVLASPLDESAGNFPVHAIFVPTLYNIALYSTPAQSIYHVIGSRESVGVGNVNPGGEQIFRIAASDGQFTFIPGHRTLNYQTQLYALDAIKDAGNYYLKTDNDTLQILSFNFDRRESVPDYLSVKELYDIAENKGFSNFAVISQTEKPLAQVLGELSRGRQLWKYFIVAALAFLLAEIVVLRFLP